MNDLSRMPKNLSAIKFGKAGFRVLPVPPNEKGPKLPEWQLKATTDRAQIEKWWEENPDYNIGLLADGYLVVDIDPARGGLASWLEMTELLEPPPTFTTKTPSGGYHLRYSLPEGVHVGNSNDTLAPGIDIKGRGGQALGPGSDINGKPYRILTEPENGIVPLLPKKKGELPVAVYAPDWLIRLCSKPAAKKSELAGIRLNEETPEAEAAAEEWIAAAPRPPNGERNTVAYQVATRAFDFGIELSTGLHLMSQWNEEVGLEEDELQATVESAYRNRSRPIGVDNPGVGPAGFEEVDLGAGEVSVPKSPWDILDFDEAADRARIGRDPIIEGVLYASEISMMYGIYGTRKTMTAMDLVLHVAAGMEWYGRAVTRGAVLWVAAEGGLGVYPRIDALRAHFKPGKIHFGVLERPLNMLSSKKDTDELILSIQRKQEAWSERLSLLVIDTLAAVSTGSDEGVAATGIVMANIRRIRQAIGPQLHILIIHHEGKTEGRGPRGTSALPSDIDTTLVVKKETKTTGTLYLKKQRNGEDEIELLKFEAKTIALAPDDKGRAVTGQVIVPRVVSAMDEVAERLKGTDDERVLKALDEMLEEREEDERIPGTANFDHEFLIEAIGRAALVDRNGHQRVVTNMVTRLTADYRHVTRLIKRLVTSGQLCHHGEHEYFRGVS